MGNKASTSGASKRRRVIKLAAFQDNLCFFCEREMRLLDPQKDYRDDPRANDPDVASEDHFVPRSRGGHPSAYNRVIAHRQCNAIKGCTLPEEALVERLRLLNEKRQFAEPPTHGGMEPGAFTKPFPALAYLCDLANTVGGEEGSVLRRKLAQRLTAVMLHVKSLEPVKDRKYRYRLLCLITADEQRHWSPIGEPYDSLLNNCVLVICRRVGYPDREAVFDAAKALEPI